MSPTSRKLYPFGNTLLVPLAVGLHLPIDHNGHVPTAIKKLHHLLTFTGHRSPFRFGIGILLQTTQFVISEPGVNLLEGLLICLEVSCCFRDNWTSAKVLCHNFSCC